ncbi:MAG TPA: autotransporter outer membrane beta-barrel domain-containing protein [Stenotrophomonas sp.]|nr:autotransporter outer membrane beta-barrel domain-containing protein [Stenotrophomonas sp.]
MNNFFPQSAASRSIASARRHVLSLALVQAIAMAGAPGLASAASIPAPNTGAITETNQGSTAPDQSSSTGGTPSDIDIHLGDGMVVGSSAAAPSILLVSTGGTGGTGLDGDDSYGGAGGTSGAVSLELQPGTAVVSGSTGPAAIVLSATGGQGGTAGDQLNSAIPGQPGHGGDSAGVTLTQQGSIWSTNGWNGTTPGTTAVLLTANGGNAAQPLGDALATGDKVTGATGGAGGNGGTISYNLEQGNVTSAGAAIVAVSQGGEGGAGTNAYAADSFGGTGGAGGNGGLVHIQTGQSGGTAPNIKAIGADYAATGATVPIDANGNTAQAAVMAAGIQAQSLGGAGGLGGFGDGGNTHEAAGGTAGSGGEVQVALGSTNITTTGFAAAGVLAQSVGGAGGNGAGTAGLWSHGGGKGGPGGDGGVVQVGMTEWTATSPTSLIKTAGNDSMGIVAQSVGGGGGAGGSMQTGSLIGGVAIGGDGESGGTGSLVTLNNGTANGGSNGAPQTGFVISTKGARSSAMVAQSIGGGGGSGGSASNTSIGIFNYAVGGSGGSGGSAGTQGTNQVTIYNNGIVSTTGDHAKGVVGQAVGGGGGDGGSAVALSASSALNINVGVGGSGGNGGTAGDVQATNAGQILTSGGDAWGLEAQSISDGGGNGGMSKADAYTLAVDQGVPNITISVGVGGKGGDGAQVGNVGADNSGLIMTSGAAAHGMLAQSIGGGGGAGGDSSAQAITAGAVGDSINVAVDVGGQGGQGGSGGQVRAYNDAGSFIFTAGNDAAGIFAQSVGGGGGHGGTGASDTRFVGQKSDDTASLSLSVGGSGGNGAAAGPVYVHNDGNILTIGDGAKGVFAQAVGGGGGAAAGGTAKGSGSKQAEVISVGGEAGSGANGSLAQVNNTGNIVTYGGDASAIYAQSIGGGGGKAGQATTAGLPSNTATLADWLANSTTLKNNLQDYGGVQALQSGDWSKFDAGTLEAIASDYMAYAASLKNDPADATSGSATVNMGAGGGSGAGGHAKGTTIGDGGQVSVNNTGGTLLTSGPLSAGMFAQSVGGGGGDAGAMQVSTIKATGPLPTGGTVTIGGRVANDGGGGEVDAYNTGGVISTQGDASAGIFAQSVGGGGGHGAMTASSYATGGTPLALTLGGDGGSTGDGGQIVVMHAIGANGQSSYINTAGNDSVGVLAQSVGGGGGDLFVLHTTANAAGYSVGSSDPTLDASGSQIGLTVGGVTTPTNACGAASNGGQNLFSACGKGGNVLVQSQTASFNTKGRNAHGILAQSIGGGGGWVAGLTFNTSDPFAGTDNYGNKVYATMGGNAGSVTVNVNGDVVTSGDGAYGILAQSIGGGGILGGDLAAGGAYKIFPLDEGSETGPAVNRAGNGGAVAVTVNGYEVLTKGANAPAIFAQSVGGGGGLFATTSGVMLGSTQGTGYAGSINITNNNGTIQAMGNGSSAIFTNSEGHWDNGDNSDVFVQNNGGKILGNASAPVVVFSGRYNQNGNGSMQNTGMVAPVDASGNVVSGTAVQVEDLNAADQQFAVVDNNTGGSLYGNVNIGARGTLNNSGTWGTDVSSTVGTVNNSGTLIVNGFNSGSLATSTITGNLNNSGTIETAIDFEHNIAPLYVQGTTTLTGGTIVLSPTRLLPIPTLPLNAFVMGSQVNVVDTGNFLFSYSGVNDGQGDFLVTPKSQLVWQANAGDLGGNLLQTATNLENNFTATAGDTMAQTYANLSTIKYMGGYIVALENLGSEGAQAASASHLVASQAFVERMNSCPQFDGNDTTLREHDCGWVRVIAGDADHEATSSSIGYQQKGQSVQFGGQREVGNDWFLGGSVSYDRSDLDSHSVDGSLDGKGWSVGVIAKHQMGDWLVSGALDGGSMSYDSDRHLLFSSVDRHATSQFDVSHIGLHARIARQIPFADWYLKPYVDLHATRLESGSYTEQGAGELSLQVKSSDQTVFSAAPMLEAGGRFDLGKDRTLQVYGGVGGAFYSADNIGADMSFVEGDPSKGTFHINTDLPQERLKASAGVDMKASEHLDVKLEYNGEFADHYQANTGTLKLSYVF